MWKIETIKNRKINIDRNLVECCKRNNDKVRSKKLVILKMKTGCENWMFSLCELPTFPFSLITFGFIALCDMG